MAESVIQHAFHSGEWSPELFARVDLQKYHAAAAKLRNFYVDYRGGASTRMGTRFVNRGLKGGSPIRLIPFQPTATTSYVLEFGDGYIRFYSNGAPILESGFTVTAASGNTITASGNNYNAGDWVFYLGAYYIVLTTGASFTVSDLWGAIPALTFSGSPTVQRVFTLLSPFAASDLFPNPRTADPGIKYAQSVQSLIICHPSYAPQILTINSPNNWTITAINFGATIGTPTGLNLTTNLTATANTWNYAYTVTAVDVNGQESQAPTSATLTGFDNLQLANGSATTGATITLSWTAVTGAVSYNVYKASALFNTAFPTGTPFGFIANTTALSFVDASPGIAPDFSQTPPIGQNPFQGAGVQTITVTAPGTYTTVPGVSVATPPAGGFPCTAAASLGVTSATVNSLGGINTSGNNPQGSTLIFPNGVNYLITSASWTGFAQNGTWAYNINSIQLLSTGSITGVGSSVPSNPVGATGCSVSGFQNFFSLPKVNLTWGVTQVSIALSGAGYLTPPAVTFSAGAATATAVLAASIGGNPSVPGFLQERLCLAGLASSPMTFALSQPGSFFNFNITDPIEPDDSITGTIFSGELNDIKSLTPVPTGLLILSGRLAWILNGGGGLSAYNPITPSNAVANPQTFTGANDLPPLKINQDLLYVTNKGAYVRDLQYNIYANVFTGADISVLSSHLFFNHYLTQWAWAEEPFKIIWAVRDDGIMLSLAYVKDQEIVGWAEHDTDGQFKSVCTVLEIVEGNTVDATYVVVQRQINGQTVQYVERLADRYFSYGYEDSWSVDAGLQTVPQVFNTSPLMITGNASAVGNTVTLTDTTAVVAPFTSTMASNNWIVRAGGGIYEITGFTSTTVVTASVVRVPSLINEYTNQAFTPPDYGIWQPVTTIGGLFHLEGQTVVGVADGAVVTGTVSAGGSLTLSNAASKITLGLAFTPQLQTLPLDIAQVQTMQGRPKSISAVSVRVADALGLSIGSKFSTLVPMKDLQLGALNYYLNQTITDLVDADARTVIDTTWTIPGQYCIQQSNPYPATVLGVIPEFSFAASR